MTEDHPRLIEHAFPIKQASLDSVHEKSVRHGHISTLHIWPARRPLAACRAALIATLLPDPGTPEERQKLVRRIGGEVVHVTQKKRMPNGRVEEVVKEETVGGVLHWGRESSPAIDGFRDEIRRAYGGRAPKVLDPFAGGGAIPLEAMRLGCEATAMDINPVAWFILKCTLDYPQKLAGQHRPLPRFALESPEFMAGYFKGTAKLTKRQLQRNLEAVQGSLFPAPDTDISWHVRAWGWWVLERVRADLTRYYPEADGKPTAAYLWARTVTCKNCRATIPLLKTQWLCRKDRKRVLLTMEPNEERTGVIFGVQSDVPRVGGNSAQRREYDRRIGKGTMSSSGATCPCCHPDDPIMTMDDIRLEGQQGRLGTAMTVAISETSSGKEYRLPNRADLDAVTAAEKDLQKVFAAVPQGLPDDQIEPASTRSISCNIYGLDRYSKLFTSRSMVALGLFAVALSEVQPHLLAAGYPPKWAEAIADYLSLTVSRSTDYWSSLTTWTPGGEFIGHTFVRFALPMIWDFAEANPCTTSSGGFLSSLDWVCRVLTHLLGATEHRPSAAVAIDSADDLAHAGTFDCVITDPPYGEAISYADLADYFYVWLRRLVSGRHEAEFRAKLTDKDREIVEHVRGDKGREAERAKYESRMAQSFRRCRELLTDDGRLVVVFAQKDPQAWETLVAAIVQSGFTVTGTLPMQTERIARSRGLSVAALSSSIWLVCRKRPQETRPGWDTRVLDDMRETIGQRLRDFWDAGIRGPDFVWAATGPALEAYSKHPVVKKANQPDELMTVSEFLRHVRRIVVDFVVGRVLSGNGDTEDVSGLDDVTTYYLLHRHDFGMNDAPVGACILYAVSCNLSDGALADQYDILGRTGGSSAAAEEDGYGENDEDATEAAEVPEAGSGSQVKLRAWNQRKRKSMGYGSAAEMSLRRAAPTTESLFPELDRPTAPTRIVPLIDRVHRLMHLWKEGDVVKVDEYLELSGMRHEGVFPHLLQALIELAPTGSEERSILESISNHAASRGMRADRAQTRMDE